VVLAAIYILWMYQRVFTGPTPKTLEKTRELTLRERLVAWPLIGLMLILGFFPAIAINYLREPAQDIVSIVNAQEAGQ